MDQHMLPVEQQMCLNPALALCQKGSGTELQALQEEEEELWRKQGRMELGQGDLALEKRWDGLPREVVECPPLPGGV